MLSVKLQTGSRRAEPGRERLPTGLPARRVLEAVVPVGLTDTAAACPAQRRARGGLQGRLGAVAVGSSGLGVEINQEVTK
ncbi:MAG: hypothetical protein ACXWCV_06450 [Caldimonas sp.]